jgi:hypothetical protein
MSEEKSTDEVIEGIKETVEDAVETVEEAIEDAVDTTLPPLLKLKQENPKVFFGGIAGIIAVLGIFFMSGGSSKTGHVQQSELSVGQTYTLQATNSLADTSLKILKIPGQMASFDNDDDVICKAPSGTRVIIRSFQEAFGKKNLFAQVEIPNEVSDCRAGVKGWTLSVNLK